MGWLIVLLSGFIADIFSGPIASWAFDYISRVIASVWRFALYNRSGKKKCYMLSARELSIEHGLNPEVWQWTSHPDSRFPEVAELVKVWWLDIRGKIKTQLLSAKTTYVACLVFKLAESSEGLEKHPAKASIIFLGGRRGGAGDEMHRRVYLKTPVGREDQGNLPRERNDGWMEVDIGEFFNDEGDDGMVEMRLVESEHLHYHKSGLIVQGLELRPKEDTA